MAISTLPIDGLINRLIQQNQHISSSPKSMSLGNAKQPDQVNISHQARAQAGSSMLEQTPSQLESKLLDMYKPGSGSSS